MIGGISVSDFFTNDGIRGYSLKEITCEDYLRIGRAFGFILSKGMSKKPYVLVARDTRITSEMFMDAFISGLCSSGADIGNLGILPTPAAAVLTRLREADASVVITASHNSFEYNGLKIFSGLGYKFPIQVIEEIRRLSMKNPEEIESSDIKAIGKITEDRNAFSDYVKFLRDSISDDLKGMRIAIDCADGSAYETAEKLFGSFGATCFLMNCRPNGTNINECSGSTNVSSLSKLVVDKKCDLGIAFDGDADRCIAVDEKGMAVNGDKLLGIFAKDLDQKGMLRDHTVVTNMICGLGLINFCEKNNIKLVNTSVGEHHVLMKMLEEDTNLAGEQSGHIIFRDFSPTSDGQLTALKLIDIMRTTGKKLSELASQFENYPQIIVNVKIGDEARGSLECDEVLQEAIGKIKGTLGSNGRVLVRESETEPVIRIMLEGKGFDIIKQHALKIEDMIRKKYQG